TVVMPEQTPLVKVRNTEAFGAKVVLEGETLAESQIRAEQLVTEEGLTLIHPYDDPAIIAGQGTAALEMLEDAPDLDILVVIIGVESELYPSMVNAMTGGERPTGGPSLAEGIAVKNVGTLTLPVVRDLVSEVLLASEPALERAVNAFATLQKTMAEGAGAAGLAAMLSAPERF